MKEAYRDMGKASSSPCPGGPSSPTARPENPSVTFPWHLPVLDVFSVKLGFQPLGNLVLDKRFRNKASHE